MTAKRILQSLVIVLILAASFASTGGAFAWSGCANTVTVQWGDTLNSIASACGTTVQAIQAANPGLGWWLYPGQVLNIPMGNNPAYNPPQMGSTYVIQWGDTLGDIAVKYGVSLSDILAVNPQIWNASLVFPGQMINLPALTNIPPSTNYPSTYNPNTCNPSPYNPSACDSSNYNPPSYNPSTFDPNTCNPSPYNPSACNPSNYNPPSYNPPSYNTSNCSASSYYSSACNPSYYSPANSPYYSDLKVTSGPGLLVRAGPGMNYIELRSPFVSAVNNSEWRYRINSVTIDPAGLVWVEVALSQQVNGYSTGWIMVRDQLGTHFTEPNIDPDP